MRPRRPYGLTEAGVFAWFMPGDPPLSGCWDWPGATAVRGGYGVFSMTDPHKRVVKAHIVSHQIYHGPIPQGLKVLHSCDRPICVHPSHLRVGTDSDNVADAVSRNRFPVGEARRNTKLTTADVLLIRQSPLSGIKLAKQFDVCHSAIDDIRNGISWKHLL